MTALERPRMSFWKAVFLAIVAVGLVLCYVRFTKGLGAVTNLSDKFPWGLWVGFDLLCGVGLAAGGFVITATVYIFHIERLRPVVRATILTAFLGYILVVSALMFDIGRPWAMWHPLVMWNPHSVMFEVSWCVTLYTTVLFLEFSGMIFEKLKWPRAMKVQHAITLPCVVAGVLLSTLHQSSLGTVYLIVPGKLHALWYTQTLPILFWISSVAAGLAMLIFESRLSSKAFGRQLEMPILSEAGRVLAAVLGVYGALRVYDLGTRGMFGQALDFSYESRMFLLEFVGGLLVPFVMLLFPKVRANAKWLYGAAVLTILGFVTNRLNVSITGFEGAQGGTYLPSVSETLITVFFVALGFGAFALGVRHLNIYPENEEKHGAGTKTAKPEVGTTVSATVAAPVVREMATVVATVRSPTA